MERPRLMQRLDDGLRLGNLLTLVCAPPGYGKTTLLSAWVHAGAAGAGETPHLIPLTEVIQLAPGATRRDLACPVQTASSPPNSGRTSAESCQLLDSTLALG